MESQAVVQAKTEAKKSFYWIATQVLEAIYGEGALVDLRKDDAWKIPRPPDFLLTVTSNHDSKSVG